MTKLRVAIHGAAGRMGKRLVALGAADPDIEIAAAIESASHPQLDQDAGELAGIGRIGVPIRAGIPRGIDAVIDFSVPQATGDLVKDCLTSKTPLVVATTGLSSEQQKMLGEAAHIIPVVWSPSMSPAVNLTMKLAAMAGRTLRDCPGGADVEIIERHHRFKEDSPSGTALRFGQIIAGEMGISGHRHGREGQTGKRPHDEIGYHAVRTGDNPGEHTIIFGMLGETIELTVRASNRDCYAIGALQAAKFVVRQNPGLYNMYDVLNLE